MKQRRKEVTEARTRLARSTCCWRPYAESPTKPHAGLLSPELAGDILRVNGARRIGVRIRVWLLVRHRARQSNRRSSPTTASASQNRSCVTPQGRTMRRSGSILAVIRHHTSPQLMLNPNQHRHAPASRRSSIFLRRIVGTMFMRVNSNCAHQVRPPSGPDGGHRRSEPCAVMLSES